MRQSSINQAFTTPSKCQLKKLKYQFKRSCPTKRYIIAPKDKNGPKGILNSDPLPDNKIKIDPTIAPDREEIMITGKIDLHPTQAHIIDISFISPPPIPVLPLKRSYITATL